MGGGNLVFAVNGERYEISAIHPSTTLIQFLRTQTPFKSVKLGCGEGFFISTIFFLPFNLAYGLAWLF